MVTTQRRNNRWRAFALTAALTIVALLLFEGAQADPTGASILSNETAGTPSPSPDSRTDDRGTITTIIINAVQQDQNWKAYVGNITGRLSLDDADGFTIYDWELLLSISGEVYVSRYGTLTFSNVSCANQINITAEYPLYNMTNNQIDNINNTFNYSQHDAFQVGTVSISADSCPSTSTYVNDTIQNKSTTQVFQELILQDTSNRLVYVTLINDDEYSYNNRSYDFQMIVPESDTNSTPTTYYFWTELSG